MEKIKIKIRDYDITLEEAKITAKNEKYYQTVIIDLENEVYSDIEKLKIMDRYEIEVENKKLTAEEISNLTNLYFTKPKNIYIGNEEK